MMNEYYVQNKKRASCYISSIESTWSRYLYNLKITCSLKNNNILDKIAMYYTSENCLCSYSICINYYTINIRHSTYLYSTLL
jgi:hypothetical protein